MQINRTIVETQIKYTQAEEIISKRTTLKALNAFFGFGIILIVLSITNFLIFNSLKLPQIFILAPIGTLLTTSLAVSYTHKKRMSVKNKIKALEKTFMEEERVKEETDLHRLEERYQHNLNHSADEGRRYGHYI